MKTILITLLTLILIVTVCFIFTGCAQVVDIQQEIVEVQIVDSYHRSVWLQPMRVGKVTTMITHPAQYKIIVEYNGNEYSFDDQATYNKYKNSIGEYINAVLETKTYDNGKVRQSFVELK